MFCFDIVHNLFMDRRILPMIWRQYKSEACRLHAWLDLSSSAVRKLHHCEAGAHKWRIFAPICARLKHP
jgi:hypothetical protein